MIRFKVELLDELTADGFDDLAHLVVEMALGRRDLRYNHTAGPRPGAD